MEDTIIGTSSRVRWMYVIRLAVGLGQCDLTRWKDVQQDLAECKKPLDVRLLHETREGVHALLPSFDGELCDIPTCQGAILKSMEARGELTGFIERGHLRLALANLLLHALCGNSADAQIADLQQPRAKALDEVAGMMLGQCELHPKLVLTLLSTMGAITIRRASRDLEGFPHTLAKDVESLRLLPTGVMDAVSQRTAVTTTELAGALAVNDAIDRWGNNPPLEVAERGKVLKTQLMQDIRTYSVKKDMDISDEQVAERLGTVQDFVVEAPPDQTEHGPGINFFDAMVGLLDVGLVGYVVLLLFLYQCFTGIIAHRVCGHEGMYQSACPVS